VKRQETTKNLILSPGRDLNPVPPEYEAGVPSTRPRHSVVISDDRKLKRYKCVVVSTGVICTQIKYDNWLESYERRTN
jgi:hypothetical protein